jgi:hypothetical protein
LKVKIAMPLSEPNVTPYVSQIPTDGSVTGFLPPTGALFRRFWILVLLAEENYSGMERVPTEDTALLKRVSTLQKGIVFTSTRCGDKRPLARSEARRSNHFTYGGVLPEAFHHTTRQLGT